MRVCVRACMRACVRARARVCVYQCGVRGMQHYDYIIPFGGFSVYIFVYFVKCIVLTLVGEIWRFGNDRLII